MSIRWRKDGRLICGAMSEPEEGDTYIDDRLHEMLGRCLPESLDVLIPDSDHENNGLWYWRNPNS